jgi:hypothetical protein
MGYALGFYYGVAPQMSKPRAFNPMNPDGKQQRREYMKQISPERITIKGWIVYTPSPNAIKIDGVMVGDSDFKRGNYWIPNSHVFEIHREKATTGFDRVVISAWIAKQKGLI